jgi:hypothetical protein
MSGKPDVGIDSMPQGDPEPGLSKIPPSHGGPKLAQTVEPSARKLVLDYSWSKYRGVEPLDILLISSIKDNGGSLIPQFEMDRMSWNKTALVNTAVRLSEMFQTGDPDLKAKASKKSFDLNEPIPFVFDPEKL